MGFLRWIGRNLSTLILAFIMALVVWGSAEISDDPNEERVLQVQIEVIGERSDMEIINSLPDQAQLTLYAPSTILDKLEANSENIRAWVDITDLDSGQHTVQLNYQLPSGLRPLRIVSVSPENVDVNLEQLVSRTLPLQTKVTGTPALGYQVGDVDWSDTEIVVSGRLSSVEQVTNIEASLDITGENDNIQRTILLIPRDDNGKLVSGVDLEPPQVTVTQTITLRGGYRNMVIKVMTVGQVAEGYRQTNITVSPPNVMVFSPNPVLLDQLPGYIETEFLDLTDRSDDIETVLALNLPEGISVIGDPNVLVLVGVAAIEDSIQISRNVEVIGILPELEAMVSPDTVEVIIFGPIPTLNTLTNVDVRVVVNLEGLEPGVYQLRPEVIILPDQIRLQAIAPETIEVTITAAQPNTLELTPSPTPTLAP